MNTNIEKSACSGGLPDLIVTDIYVYQSWNKRIDWIYFDYENIGDAPSDSEITYKIKMSWILFGWFPFCFRTFNHRFYRSPVEPGRSPNCVFEDWYRGFPP